MKILFWSAVIIGAIYWLMKRQLGTDTDLTAHLAEQNALRQIGDVSNESNVLSTGDWPLATIGSTPFAGLPIDPMNAQNPFSQINAVDLFPGTPRVQSAEG